MRERRQKGRLTSKQIPEIWSSSSVLLSMTSVSAPPSMYSMTTQSSVFLTRYDSRKLTMLGCILSFMTRISLTMSSFLGCAARSICLMATLLPFSRCFAT